MNTDDFENQLRRVPMREIPAEWRAAILARAEGGGQRAEKGHTGCWWRDLLWPSPLAWGALACVWIGIFISNIGTPGAHTPPATATSNETLVMRFAQERSLIENKGMF